MNSDDMKQNVLSFITLSLTFVSGNRLAVQSFIRSMMRRIRSRRPAVYFCYWHSSEHF